MAKPLTAPPDTHDWHAKELLLMREVMRLSGQSLSPHRVLREMLHLMSELATLAGQMLKLDALVGDQTRQLEARNAVLAHALNAKTARYGLIGNSPPLLQALSKLERVSQTQATVLLLGESGTGKELFARAVHLASGRRDQPFIKVNCSAIPDTLFESELFGHERGAQSRPTLPAGCRSLTKAGRQWYGSRPRRCL